MKIAVCSDELYPIHKFVVLELERRGHEVFRFGSFLSHKDEPYVEVAVKAAKLIKDGKCDEGVFFCYTGTGISIAANKVRGIRAALCTDAETARGARIWNHANVLALSNRLLSQDIAREILAAWFDTSLDERGAKAVKQLENVELCQM